MEKTRDNWSSRVTFIFAAIGSAVGLGNAWRFPGLAAQYGGGAFLLVFFLAMIILGWPLLCMEIALGRKTQKGVPGALYSINKKFEFVGWASVANAFIIVCYYTVILAWVIVMIFKSFDVGAMNTTQAGNVFINDVLKCVNIGDAGSMDVPGALIWALIAAWVMMYLCIRKGARGVGKVVKYTVMIPIILLFILAVNGIIKDISVSGGAGLATFFKPDFSRVIAEGKMGNLFLDAFGQVFYSLSIMMAIMVAYGSFVDKKSDIVKDTMIVAIGDFSISMLAGIVLFTTLSGTGMLESYLKSPSGGVVTAFIIYPQAIVSLTDNAIVNGIFALIFYLTLFTLAIDSAFSIVEGVSASVSDKLHIEKKKTTLAVCGVAGIISIIFVTRSGLNWLDIVDNWANSFSLILVGILECITIGWFFKPSKLRDEMNRTITPFKIGKKQFNVKIGPWYDWIIKVVSPLILSVFMVWNIVTLIISYATGKGGYGGYPIWAQVVAGWALFVGVFVVAAIIQIVSRKNKKILELDATIKSWDEMHAEDENKFILAQMNAEMNVNATENDAQNN